MIIDITGTILTPGKGKGRYRTRYAFSPLAKIEVVTSVCTGHSNMPQACRTAMGSSPISNAIPKKKDHPIGWSFFLVDDIGLEPMTFRTSSGCSSQLS